MQPIHVAGMALPRFKGELTTRAVTSQWLAAEDAIEIAETHDIDPYVGTLPNELKKTSGWTEKQGRRFFDALAQSLYPAMNEVDYDKNQPLPKSLIKPALKILPWRLRGKAPEISFLDAGKCGQVFQVRSGDQAYVYKIGRFLAQDITNAAYLTALGTSNVSQFHTGNITTPWVLMEYVDTQTDVSTRPGKTFQDWGFQYFDELKPDNWVGKIFIDHTFLEDVHKGEVWRLRDLNKRVEEIKQTDPPEKPTFWQRFTSLFRRKTMQTPDKAEPRFYRDG